MPTNIVMPQMGESIFEGTITKWLKKEGEAVKRDEPLFEISTDKIDTEIQSAVGGTLKKILMPEGSKVPINTVVAIIDEVGASAAPTPAPAATRPQAAPTPTPAPAPKQMEPVPVAAVGSDGGNGGRVFASPLVRRIARQENVDLKQLEGSGWKGRITKKDIEDFIGKGGAPAAAPTQAPAPVPTQRPAATPASAPAPTRAAAVAGRTQVVPMTNMRAKIAEHMVKSKATSAHVTTCHQVDVSRIAEIREREKADYETVYGSKLTLTHFFAGAVVQVLKEFPLLNASIDGSNIVYHNYINLGMAVAVPEGLIVPVIKNCEEKSFLGLVRGVNDVAERAKTKKLTIDDIQGGTFTVTNPGPYGAAMFTPIINQPQVAILGIGSVEKRPVVINDAIAIRSMVYLCLSFDHRIVDGIDAEKFMARLREIIQTWNIPIK
ncbi:MAG TPA: dihydrolipoamide acetyltransferase family protein [Planctomycetota bacterium]|nr:dihydrolipoamide acetyltransferase family protein [Planctomycetota bacterium]